MKRYRFLAACAGSLLILGYIAPVTLTQEAPDDSAATAGSGKAIGLIDVAYVIQHHPRFTEALAELKAAVDAAEAEVKKKQQELAGMQQQLALLVVGTAEHRELERQITMAQAELAGRVQAEKLDFVRREARLYHDADLQISREVEDYARTHGLSVVLRFSAGPVNANDPKAVLQSINRPIVWHDGSRDLTRIILQRLTQEAKRPEQPGESPAGSIEEPIPEAPQQPEKEDDHGDGPRTSHLG